jgi:hypothetical protein
MGSWKRLLKPLGNDAVARANARSSYLQTAGLGALGTDNINLLNDVLYRGREDRMERYLVYEQMDNDLDIARGLDMIAEHCTAKDPKSKTPFVFDFRGEEVTQEDSDVLAEMLQRWVSINEWDNRIWRTVRNVIMYGDAFFIRDPKTYVLHSVAPNQVIGAYVNEDTFEIEAYHFEDLNFNVSNMTANMPGIQPGVSGVMPGSPQTHNRLGTAQGLKQSVVIDAVHVVHISLSEGQHLGGNGQDRDIWPFGESFLEQIYKSYKQRQLLEDAVLIHRVQRAPSRRVWYIDVGKMRPDKAESVIRKFRNEIIQKRVPNKFGGQDVVDSVYNPLSQLEDFFLPQLADSRGSRVDNLEGQQWTNMDDLKYWTLKVLRGLRVPVSFMLGPEEGGAQFSDGRTGTAYMQEQQFARFCERIQDLIDNVLDEEFKLFLKVHEIQIHASDYQLKFVPPMNFDFYRESALNQERLAAFGQVSQTPHISKRMALQRYLGWSDDDVLLNEKLWLEEQNPSAAMAQAANAPPPVTGALGLDPAMGGGGMGMDGGMGGAMGGPDGMGGAPGMGGAMGGPGLGSAGGMPAGGMPGTEGRNMSGRVLTEQERRAYVYSGVVPARLAEDVDPKQIRPASPPASDRSDLEQDAGRDRLMGHEPGNRRNRITLKHLRKMRKEKEQTRRELAKRLEIVAKMYGAPPEGAPGGMF